MLLKEEKIAEIADNAFGSLKDFQQSTVNCIVKAFKGGQKKVLVADEVGLGKTIVAKGVIAQMAKQRLVKEKAENFKIVYICSNQALANQNLNKLNIFGAELGDASKSRLSMQHLYISQQNKEQIQFISMTPATSFDFGKSRGTVLERALLYAILSETDEFKYDTDNNKNLETLLKRNAKVWELAKKSIKEEIKKIPLDGCSYTDYIKSQIPDDTLDELKSYLNRASSDENQATDIDVIKKLRKMSADISLKMMEPDLVIMDEFQRFEELLKESDSEMGMLANEFVKSDKTYVLMLSATPYKMYPSCDESSTDDGQAQFYTVMEYILGAAKFKEFEEQWENYSNNLRKINKDNIQDVIDNKNAVEERMDKGICRTERISVMDNGDYLDDSSVKTDISIEKNDILSYMQMRTLMDEIGKPTKIDYVKSCPYLLSFMNDYEEKRAITEHFSTKFEEIEKANKNLLWLDKKIIEKYGELDKTNARLEQLKSIFSDESYKYLWVPPSRPYYEMEGVYKGCEDKNFSKLLVFSSWSMVPKMIATMISYESERVCIGELAKTERYKNKWAKTYFIERKKRFPKSRLNLNSENQNTKLLFTLIYPSKVLSELYNPMEIIKDKTTLEDVKNVVERELQGKLAELNKALSYSDEAMQNIEDPRWYLLTPILLDYKDKLQKDIATGTIKLSVPNLKELLEYSFDTESKQKNKHISEIVDLLGQFSIGDKKKNVLGKQPKDLLDVLTNLAIGSPANCIYRAFKDKDSESCRKEAVALSCVFLERFDTCEAIAIVDLAYNKDENPWQENQHWKYVLKYCVDGNFQAMFDEYKHIMTENLGTTEVSKVAKAMMEALSFRGDTYTVDTFEAFKERVSTKAEDGKNTNAGIKLRYEFGTALVKDSKKDDEEGKTRDRNESVQKAFNCPLRPFVLASTSVGQEGLDFHAYCRKIMHWNLPKNPVDFEQREGRVNRYKCLAVRQDVAKKYGAVAADGDLWEKMFEAAAKDAKKDVQPELVPFWCLGEGQTVKIERIVPMYPFSADRVNYERLIDAVTYYRLTLGQPRQEELLEHILKEFKGCENKEILKKLFINLCPYTKKSLKKKLCKRE